MAQDDRTGAESQQNKSASREQAEFFRVLARLVEQQPNEMAVIADHVSRHSPSVQAGGSLVDQANQHHELLLSLLQTERGREAAQTLGQAYQRMGGPVRGAGKPGEVEVQLLPLIITLAVFDTCLWGYILLK